MDITVHRDGTNYGPFNLDQVREYIGNGSLLPTDLAWYEGRQGWAALSDVLIELSPATLSTPPLPATTGSMAANSAPVGIVEPAKPKSFYVALTFCLLLGMFGAHRFYLRKQSAWIMLFTLGACGLWWYVDLFLLLINQIKYDDKPLINPKPLVTWPIAVIWMGLLFALGANDKDDATAPSTAQTESPQPKPPQTTDSTASQQTTTVPAVNNTPSQVPVVPPPAPTYLPKTVKLGHLTIEVQRIEVRYSIGSYGFATRPSPGAVFVLVRYSITNNSDETEVDWSDNNFVLRDSQDRKFTPSSDAITALMAENAGKDFILTELQPGVTKPTVTAFEIPEASSKSTLTFVIAKGGFFGGTEKIQLQ